MKNEKRQTIDEHSSSPIEHFRVEQLVHGSSYMLSMLPVYFVVDQLSFNRNTRL
jgi:hypothetical protein